VSRALPASLFAALWLWATAAAAVDTVRLDLAQVAGPGWQAKQVHVGMTLLPDGGLALELGAAEAELPPPLGRQTDLRLSCAHARLDGPWIACPAAEARLRLPGVDQNPLALGFRYRPADKTLTLNLPDTSVAGGRLKLSARLGPSGWSADIHARHLDAARLPKVAKALGLDPGALNLSGRADLDAQLSGSPGGLRRARFDVKLPGFGFLVGDGSNAAEGLNLDVAGQLDRAGTDAWHLDATLHGAAGTLCLSDCWNLPPKPLTVRLTGTAHPGAGTLSLTQVSLNQPDQVQASGRLSLGTKDGKVALHSLHLDLQPSRLGELYRRYLQPLLIGTAGESLDADGQVSGTLDYADAGIQASLTLGRANIDDRKGRFGLYGVGGDLRWSSTGPAHPARLHWNGGHLFQFGLGAATMELSLSPRSVRLSRTANIGILDGALQVDHFQLDHPEDGDTKVEFDGVLEPVSMQAVSHALGWPVMSGKLSGVIPAVTYDHGSLDVGGVLLVRAFDGTITISGLRLEQLFGLVPTLAADVDIQRLDLDALTRTFSFGSMQGRISGHINGLRMQDWKPVAFDARLGTPANDDSRHRISQKAVENLTSIGGGGLGGALQRQFLSFFKEFSYDRLGLSCHLENGVCRMGGVAPASQGYYIVKGGGLPRIDIVGFQKQVDWNELVARLESAIASSPAVVR